MSELTLTWLATVLFALVIVWGTDVPATGRRPVLSALIVVMALFGLFAQTFYFAEQDGGGLEKKVPAAVRMASENSDLRAAVATLAMEPGELRAAPVQAFYKVFTSSLTHYGWLTLALNAWFIFVFGHALEGLIGKIRFGLVVLAGMIVPPLLDGFLPVRLFLNEGDFVGGASGIVYAVFGAALVRLPRARVYVALNTAMDFWGLTFILLLPMTYITMLVDFSLTQLLLLIGITALFLIIQPASRSLTVPLWAGLAYKLFLDIALIWPLTAGVISNSPWRIIGGLASGGVVGLALCGTRGFRERWSDEPAPRVRRGGTGRKTLQELEKAANRDEASARAYLGQRVFIGDVARVLDFYRDVVMEKFPDLVLPPQEQLALARLLQSKARDAEALHAYEGYLKTYEPDEARWSTWMTAAELLIKSHPDRAADARRYLQKFLENEKIMMRDRVEAERLLKELPEVQEPPARPVHAEPQASVDAAAAQMAHREQKEVATPASNDDIAMPRLKPMSFEMVDGVVQEERHRSKKEQVEETAAAELTKLYWKLHPVRERPDQKEEALFPVKVKHSWDVQSVSSGAYGVDLPEGGSASRRPRGRMAHLEAHGESRYAQMDTEGGIARQKRSANEDSSDRMPKNYGGATDAPGGERPRIRLAREARKSS